MNTTSLKELKYAQLYNWLYDVSRLTGDTRKDSDLWLKQTLKIMIAPYVAEVEREAFERGKSHGYSVAQLDKPLQVNPKSHHYISDSKDNLNSKGE